MRHVRGECCALLLIRRTFPFPGSCPPLLLCHVLFLLFMHGMSSSSYCPFVCMVFCTASLPHEYPHSDMRSEHHVGKLILLSRVMHLRLHCPAMGQT